MKRFLVIACLGLLAVLLVRRFVGRGVDWKATFARLPATSPRKWMFNNISAIRENTDAILERMDRAVAGSL